MNIDYRLRQLESRTGNKPRSASQLNYLTQMVALSGCGLTVEQLDDGQNLGVLELVLKAYGVSDTRIVTDIPKPNDI